MDFTPGTYTRLLAALQAAGYASQTIADFFESPQFKTVLLRHDVDLLPQNALAMANLEHGMGVVAIYYFRAVPESWDEGIIREIAGLGHEVGYHYENIDSIIEGFRNLGIEDNKTIEGCKTIEGFRNLGIEGLKTIEEFRPQ